MPLSHSMISHAQPRPNRGPGTQMTSSPRGDDGLLCAGVSLIMSEIEQPRCRKTCRTGPIQIVRREKRQQGKGAHVCTKMYIHRDFYDQTLAPKREIDVLRARSPAGSHLQRQDTHIPAYHVQQPTTEHTTMQRCANMLRSRRLTSQQRPR